MKIDKKYKKVGILIALVSLFLIATFSTYQICLLLLPNSEKNSKVEKTQNTYLSNSTSNDNKIKEPTKDYKKGLELLNKKDYYNACLSFQNVNKDDPYYNESLKRISECQQAFEDIKFAEVIKYEDKNDYRSAISCIDSILKINPNQAKALKYKDKYSNLNKEKENPQNEKKVKTSESSSTNDKQPINNSKPKIDICKTIYICGGSDLIGDYISWTFNNSSDKSIQNVSFNRSCGYCYKATKVLKPNDFTNYKEPISCSKDKNCELIKVVIEYMDGTKITIPKDQIKYLADQAQLQLKIDNKQIFVNEE